MLLKLKQIMKKLLLVLCALVCTSLALQAQQDLKRAIHFNTYKGLALKGYDPVAYHIQGVATLGSTSFTTVHQGVKYHFSSEGNRDLFVSNPSKYEPKGGSWCAYAMGVKGDKVPVSPNIFLVLNGKLYLFYNEKGKSTFQTHYNKLSNGVENYWTAILK